MPSQHSSLLRVGLTALVVGCAAAPPAPPPPLHQTENAVVRLETPPPGAEPPQFQHPLTLSAEDMARVLREVRLEGPSGMLGFLRRQRPPSRLAFTQDEAEIVAAPLAAALAQAGPDQRVAFAFQHPRSRISSGITSGVLFAKSDRLHFIFGRYRSTGRPHQPQTGLDGPALPDPPYKGFRLAAGPHIALIDATETPLWGVDAGRQHWVMVDHAALLASAPAPEEFPVAEPESAAEPEDPEKARAAEIKERLRALKEMRDENLISEEEYEKKRKKVLDGF
jgi:hypothetical protein